MQSLLWPEVLDLCISNFGGAALGAPIADCGLHPLLHIPSCCCNSVTSAARRPYCSAAIRPRAWAKYSRAL